MQHLTWTVPPLEYQHLFTPLVRSKKASVVEAAQECAAQSMSRRVNGHPVYICLQNFGHGPRVFGTEQLDLTRGHEEFVVAVWKAWINWFLQLYKRAGGVTPDGFVFDYERQPKVLRENRMRRAAYIPIAMKYGDDLPITNWYGGHGYEGTVVYGPDHAIEDAKIRASIRRVGADRVWPWVRYPGTHRRRLPPSPVPSSEIEERLRRLVHAGITTFQWWGPRETYPGMWVELADMVSAYSESGVDDHDDDESA